MGSLYFIRKYYWLLKCLSNSLDFSNGFLDKDMVKYNPDNFDPIKLFCLFVYWDSIRYLGGMCARGLFVFKILKQSLSPKKQFSSGSVSIFLVLLGSRRML